MAEATFPLSMTGQAESSTAAAIFRNDDPLTQALRDPAAVDINEIARLNRALSPVYDGDVSLRTPSAELFSARDDSTFTKPTSIGTHDRGPAYKGKGKAKVSYASSLSVAYGSGSEAERKKHTENREILLAMGHWAPCDVVPHEPLRGAARAQKRYNRRPKHKKPVVELHQRTSLHKASEYDEHDSVITIAPTITSREKSYFRRRGTQCEDYQLRFAEEGQTLDTVDDLPAAQRISPMRRWICTGMIVLTLLVIAFSAFSAHYCGKAGIAHVKLIIFVATVLVAILTVAAMVTVRRAPQEAMLAGLLEIIIGFVLLMQLEDFI